MGSYSRPFRRKAILAQVLLVAAVMVLSRTAESRSREKEGRRRSNDRLPVTDPQPPKYANSFVSSQNPPGGLSEESSYYNNNGYGGGGSGTSHSSHDDDLAGGHGSSSGSYNGRMRNTDKYGGSGGSTYNSGGRTYGSTMDHDDGVYSAASHSGTAYGTSYGGSSGSSYGGSSGTSYGGSSGSSYGGSSGSSYGGSSGSSYGGNSGSSYGTSSSSYGSGSGGASGSMYGSSNGRGRISGGGSYGDNTANPNTGIYPRGGYVSSASSSYGSYSSDTGHISPPKSYSVTKYSDPGTYITGSPLYNIEADVYEEPTGRNEADDFTFLAPFDQSSLCMRKRDMKLMCYCTPDENHVPVRKTECWIFSNELTFNDTTWTRFFQHRRMRDIKIVVQNHGHLTYIPTAVLKVLRNLTSILIEYSSLDHLPAHAFANLQYLEIIVLTNNRINMLDQNCFANHVRLREMNLENNKIRAIDRFAFRNLPSMERLHMNTNDLSSIPEGCFLDMPHLIYLNLAGNLLSVLTRDVFVGLGNLNVLILSNNKINFIGDTIFTELWSLYELDLSNNSIQRISERALDGLNNLRSINLRNNNLVKIDAGILRGTPALLAINLQHNKLITLNYLTFQPIMDNLINSSGELQLSNNNFVCDCRLEWLFELKNRTNHNPLRESLDELVCTLQDPAVSYFERPVPSHIMDLLIIGGYHVEEETTTTTTVSPLSLPAASKRSALKQHRNQLAQLQSLVADEPSREVESMMKRSIPNGGEVDDATATTATTTTTTTAGSAALEANDYPLTNGILFEDTFMKMSRFRQEFGDDDDDDEEQEEGLEILGPVVAAVHSSKDSKESFVEGGDSNDLVDYETTELPIIFTGIKVRLFTLKSDTLPCPEEVLDPTELPLSRDLMDVRTNGSATTFVAVGQRCMALMMSLTLMTLLCLMRHGAMGMY